MATRKHPSKRTLAVGLIRDGMSVNDAAARLGITPNNIYRCPAYKALLAERQKIIEESLK
jgi:transposase